MKTSPLQLVLADDHKLFQDAISAYLERAMLPLEITCYSDMEGVESHLKKKVPDLLLLDWKMPGMHGDETIQRLKKTWPKLNLALLSSFVDDPRETKDGGVRFISKHVSGQALLRHIYDLLGLEESKRPKLTRRELDVLAQLKKGASNKQIAQALDIKEITVKLHLRHICRKFGFRNRTQLALSAPLLVQDDA